MDKIRVLRVLEYRGPRDKVEDLINKAVIHKALPTGVTIAGATIGNFGETLEFQDRQNEADPLYVERFDALAAIEEAVRVYEVSVSRHGHVMSTMETALVHTIKEILGNTLGDET